MSDSFIPESDNTEKFIFFVLVLLGIVIIFLESTGNNIPYSKFELKNERGFAFSRSYSTRKGLFLIYISTIFSITIIYICDTRKKTPYHIIVYIFYLINYLKRCFEVLFIHKFSKKSSFFALLYIGISNTLVNTILCRYILLSNKNMDDSNFFYLILPFPLILFGWFGTFYHHILLAKLRRSSRNAKRYKIPRGGLFDYVSCPHYFMEFLTWAGFSVIVHRLSFYGHVIFIFCTFVGRSYQTKKWYNNNIVGYPRKRKCLIPLIF
ncbi:hypothetical protein H8356DRAFT_1035082 [Neocallimastix lanati (nom. inval.)]|jgi:very-long-chain enoyl-CoA reductase|nr:hypothetical protein H8356DRAFT_1035082 [Neocallimastix sp. JGI-2020a]